MQPFLQLIRNSTPKTIGTIAIVIALLLVIPLGLRLNQQSQSPNSQAAPESAKVAGTSLSLEKHRFDCSSADPENGIKPETTCNDLTAGKIFAVDVLVHSDIDPANLIKTQLNFDQNQLIVTKILTSNGKTQKAKTGSTLIAQDFFISNWISNNFKNDQGSLALVGSVTDPGFTTTADTPAVMARVYFKAKAPGQTTIKFDQGSSIYRSADNQNILSSTQDLNLDIQ